MVFKPTTPVDCLSLEEHERETTTIAAEAQRYGLEMLANAKGDRIQLATAKELILASVRARKVAAELAHAREGRDHSDWYLAEYKKMHGLGRAPRPALKRKRDL